MYTKIHTEGIILKKHDTGEADHMYRIFTKDLGVIYARARGIRKMTSKLRHTLQVFSHIECSLIQGKGSLQLTNAEVYEHFGSLLAPHKDKRERLGRIVALIQKLVSGNEAQENLYMTLKEGVTHMTHHTTTEEEARRLEALLVLRVLHTLGYVGNPDWFGYLLGGPYVSDMILGEMGRVETRVVREVNRSLRTIHT